MNKWNVLGNTVELSDHDYYDQWIGTIISTKYLGGLLGGYFDMHDKKSNLLEKYAQHLHQNVSFVEDETLRNLLDDFEAQFHKIIGLEKEAIAILARLLGLEYPKEVRDYRTLYRKFEREHQSINSHGFLSHPAFNEIRQRFGEIQEQQAVLKEKLLSHILAAFPDLASSEYLSGR